MSMKPKTLIAALLALVLGTWWLLGPYGPGIWVHGEERFVYAPSGLAEPSDVVEGGGSASTGTI